MLDFYFETEKQFLDLIRIIPLENNEETFSPILYNILQSSCGQVENMMRLLCDRFELEYDRYSKFPKYYELLNKNGTLERRKILQKKTQTTYTPFQINDGELTPSWWSGYNDTKHFLPDGLVAGNLKNTVQALSAVYILHCMGYYALYWCDEFFDEKNWADFEPMYTHDGEFVENKLSNLPKSELFHPITANFRGVPV